MAEEFLHQAVGKVEKTGHELIGEVKEFLGGKAAPDAATPPEPPPPAPVQAIALHGTVGGGKSKNSPDDVRALSSALVALGLLPAASGQCDDQLIKAIEAFSATNEKRDAGWIRGAGWEDRKGRSTKALRTHQP